MAASPNPLTWSSMNLMDQSQMQLFLQQLGQWANSINQSVGQIVPSQISISAIQTLLTANTAALGAQTGSFSFNCKGALLSVFSFTTNANTTLTLNNFPLGAMVFFSAGVTGGVTRTLKLAANTPTPAAYTTITCNEYNNGLDMIATGLAIPSGSNFIFSGASLAGPTLKLIAQ